MLKKIYNNFLKRFNSYLDLRSVEYFKHRRFNTNTLVNRKIVKQAKQSIEGGKRIRPFLAYLAYNATKPRFYLSNRLLNLGVGLEVLHAYLLVQDDVMDNSALRRNKLTVYKYFQLYFKESKYKNWKELGSIYATLTADLLVNMSFYFFSRIKVNILPDIIKVIDETILAQSLDVISSYNREDMTEKHIMKIYTGKTAKYTFVLPIILAHKLRSIEPSPSLLKFAYNLGVAFQIQDDILGAFGDINKTGKDNLSDLQEGKYTILINYVYKHGKPDQKELLSKYLGKRDLSINEANILREVIVDSGSLDYTRGLKERYYNDSLAFLEQARINARAKELFRELAEFVVNREK